MALALAPAGRAGAPKPLPPCDAFDVSSLLPVSYSVMAFFASFLPFLDLEALDELRWDELCLDVSLEDVGCGRVEEFSAAEL